ncbi:MAG: DNA/RNA non-specific endonuclease [Aestuariivirga sp.]
MTDATNNALLDQAVGRRLAMAAGQIGHSLDAVARGNPFGAETDKTRLLARIIAKTGLPPGEAADVAGWIGSTPPAKREVAAKGEPRMEAMVGPTLDFVGVSFLERGRTAADAVVRIRYRDGRPQGTGAMIAPGIILTNNHVIPTPGDAAGFIVEFDYEKDANDLDRPVTSFDLDPGRCFLHDPVERLDYTVIALGKRLQGSRDLRQTGFLLLSDAANKHMLGEVANIIQHPRGDFKQIVLRENRLVSRLDYVLQYVADTEPGSSGSPVFNNEWQVIALHHWGGPSPMAIPALAPGASYEINEGVRISSIVKDLRLKAQGNQRDAPLVRGLLKAWDEAPEQAGVWMPQESRQPQVTSPTLVPVSQEKVRPAMTNRSDEDFSDRAGYEPGFLSDFVVPMPRLGNGMMHKAARNLDARIGEDPHELKYHHFSIVMNGERRLAYFTACNIDGRLTRAINRKDKTVIERPTIADLQIESMGAEASDDFGTDWRVNPDQQMGLEFYQQQKVPGYADPQSRDRIARMFQKGHIIMRSDPAWGTVDMALAAERDTFFYTNAAPQLGFFNQGSRDNHPGEKGKLRWRAVETYVLRNAVKEKERVCVFAGPVFKSNDPEYRGSQVPMQFWKIVVWSDGGQPRSVALLANQQEVLDTLTNGVPENFPVTPEAFDELPELLRVKEFRSTVARIEALTGLDFSGAVRNSDIGRGMEDGDILAGELAGRAPARNRAGGPAKKAARKASKKPAAKK